MDDEQPAIRAQTDPTVRLFWILAATHLVVWTVVPFLTQPNAPLDAIEMLYWGHEWQWGYYKHPPLPAWIAEASCWFTGDAAWPTYLASQLCIVGCLWSAWQMARKTLAPWPALTAAFLLEASFYYNYTTPEFNNNLPAKLLWALAILFLYLGLVRHRVGYWMAAGAALGLAMLSKYDAAFLALALLLFGIVHPRARGAWKTAGPWAMLAVAAGITLPHLVWAVENNFPTIRYVLQRSEQAGVWFDHVRNPLEFLFSQLAAIGMVLAFAIGVLGWRWRWRSGDEQQRFQRDYLAFAVLGPFLIVTLMSLLTGAHIRSMWGAPMWTYVGVLLLVAFQATPRSVPCRRVVYACSALGIFLAVVLGVRNGIAPYVRGKPSRINFPGRPLATEVERRWHRRHPESLHVIAGDWWLAGNVAFYGSDRRRVYPDLEPEYAAWIDDEQIVAQGAVLLWEIRAGKPSMPEGWAERFPDARLEEPIVVPWQTGATLPPLTIGIAIVDPDGGSLEGMTRIAQPLIPDHAANRR